MLDARLGAGPISWGVCEVPGWGTMLPVDRVLEEMRAVGITATELGAPGFMPHDPEALRALLERHGVALIGAFLPVVAHEPTARADTLRRAAAKADLLAALGADVLVSAVVVDDGWSPRGPLTRGQWDHLLGMLGELDAVGAARGLRHVVHPHAGTLVETRADIDTVLERSDARFCLDTGHLVLGGDDPVDFAGRAGDRVGHVHLKDVRAPLADAVRRGSRPFHDAVRDGLFCPLGTGDAPIAATVGLLEAAGYDGWYVLEQDTDLGVDVPPDGAGPVVDVRTSVEFLRSIVAGTPAG